MKEHKKNNDYEVLHQDSMNFNKGTEQGGKLIEHSLTTHGAGRSILVDKNNNIIAGNKTAQTAEKLGLKLRFVDSDGKELIAVKRDDVSLNSKRGREMALADNATAIVNLSWDKASIFEAELTYEGFDFLEFADDLNIKLPSEKQTEENFFDSKKIMSFTFSPTQKKKISQKLKQIDKNLSKALLKLLGYYGDND